MCVKSPRRSSPEGKFQKEATRTCFTESWQGHTNIIGHSCPSIRIIDLVSHTTYVVCVNFKPKWQGLRFNVDSERQIFWETLMAILFLHSEFLPEICWKEIAEEILYVFCFDIWPWARTQAFRLISQLTIDFKQMNAFLRSF